MDCNAWLIHLNIFLRIKVLLKTGAKFWINLFIVKVPNSENLNTELCKMRKMGHFCHRLILGFLSEMELRVK